ncbi:hypothetical protein cypCar_00040952, partial [Cyprinus carpio]
LGGVGGVGRSWEELDLDLDPTTPPGPCAAVRTISSSRETGRMWFRFARNAFAPPMTSLGGQCTSHLFRKQREISLLAMDGCAQMCKCFLILFNILFALVGLGLVGLGMWLRFGAETRGFFDIDLNTAQFNIGVMVLVVTGVLMLLVAIIGDCGACNNSKSALGVVRNIITANTSHSLTELHTETKLLHTFRIQSTSSIPHKPHLMSLLKSTCTCQENQGKSWLFASGISEP